MEAVCAQPFAQRKLLIAGIAIERSIADGCTRDVRALGADLAIAYLNDKALRL